MRRSTRLPWEVQVTIVSLDPKISFRETGKTLVVNMHGCGIQLERPLPSGTRVRVEVGEHRMTGRVVDSGRIDDSYLAGIALDKAANIWGVKDAPPDWGLAHPLSKLLEIETPAESPADTASIPPTAAAAVAELTAPSDAVRESAYLEITAQLQRLEQAHAKFQEAFTADRASTQAVRESAEKALAEQLERVRQARAFVESLACSLPGAIKAQAQEHSKALVQQLHDDVLQEVSGRVRAAVDDMQAKLSDSIAQMSSDLRRELLDELVRRYQAEVKSAAPVSDVSAFRAALRQSAQELGADLAGQAERAAAQLRDAVSRLVADQQNKLDERDEAAKTALENVGGKLLASMRGEMQAELKRQLEGMAAPAGFPPQDARALADHLEWQNHASELAAGVREHLNRQCGEIRAAQLQQARADLELTMAGALQRADEARAELRQMLESLQSQIQGQEAAVAAVNRQLDHAQSWVAGEMKRFEETFHDALIDASGQIRGRIQQAVEMAAEPLEARSRELHQELAKVGRQYTEHLNHTAEQVQDEIEGGRQRLQASCDTAQSALESGLRMKMETTIETYRKELEQLTRSSVDRWQTAMTESLATIQRVLAHEVAGGIKPR